MIRAIQPVRAIRARQGGILLEVLLAVAIFAATAALTLQATRDALNAVERQERLAQASDLAASAMARLEAGVINIADLRGGRVTEEEGGRDERFVVELTTRRTSHTGLTLVRLAVRDAEDALDAPPIFELRQFVRLRGPDAGEEPDEDDLIAGLEESGPFDPLGLGIEADDR